MNYIQEGFIEAINLLVSLDEELYSIIFLSLKVSGLATIIASSVATPLGFYLGRKTFPFKKLFSRIIYTLMSTPSVIVGLIISILISRNGPLGFLNIIYTSKAMILAQTALLFPLVLGLNYNLSHSQGDYIELIGQTLGANSIQRIILIMSELKLAILMNIITAFSRAISEVGAVMIVGGNIKHHTRVITTTISMLNSMGDYPMAIALGIVLIIISFIINSLLYSYSLED